jgi:hypothetical protein
MNLDKSWQISSIEAFLQCLGHKRLSYPVQIRKEDGKPPWWVDGPERKYYWNIGTNRTIFKDRRGWRCVYHWVVRNGEYVLNPDEPKPSKYTYATVDGKLLV